MAVEFLTDAQVAAYGRFGGVPSRTDLDRFFLLDDADKALIGDRRGWSGCGRRRAAARPPHAERGELTEMSRLRDRVVRTAGTRGELTLYELGRATELRRARCAGRSVTRSVAVLGGNWTSLWCRYCYLAMPVPAASPGPASQQEEPRS